MNGSEAYVLAKKYHDEHTGGQAVMVGTVTNGGSFPTARPSGDALIIGDFVKPAKTSTLPFTIGGITFNSYTDQAVYDGASGWMYNANPYQKTNETPVYNKVTESISGLSNYQNQINVEVKDALEQHEFIFSTASTSWSIPHNLGKYPSVKTFDTLGNTIVGNVEYVNENTASVSFNAPQTGKAIVN